MSQGEVSDLAQSARVEDSISFCRQQQLVYALIASNEAKEILARFENARIEIIVPAAIAERWTKSEQVGFGAEQNLPDGEILKILVEKDFACLTVREGEDESDAFPHPQVGQAC